MTVLPDKGAESAYRRALARTGQSVIFRRVTGQAPNTAMVDVTVTAIFRHYAPSSEIGAKQGAISMGMREFIVLESDLVAQNFPVPLRKNDKIVLGTEAFNITQVDPSTRAFAGAIEGKAEGV